MSKYLTEHTQSKQTLGAALSGASIDVTGISINPLALEIQYKFAMSGPMDDSNFETTLTTKFVQNTDSTTVTLTMDGVPKRQSEAVKTILAGKSVIDFYFVEYVTDTEPTVHHV